MDRSEIRIYRFDKLKAESGITHAVFARSGGSSTGPFDSLNIGVNSGDEASRISENRKRVIQTMGMKPLVFLNQVHGDGIKILKKDDKDFEIQFEPGKELYTADSIVTDIKGVFMVIQVADCQAVMLYDPQKKVIANIHSGWRGSVKNIIAKTVKTMVDKFGCTPDLIKAGISPSLGPCCAEFTNYKDELPRSFWKYQTKKKYHFDFWQISSEQLKAQGIKEDHIENMGICTKCNSDRFYSYRKEKITGRFACMIALN